VSTRTATDAASSLPYGLLAVLWLVGWTLRVPILTAPPLATDIAQTFGLGEAGVGALTMLPVVAVAFGAIPAAWIITKFGLRAAIVGGLLLSIAASVSRGQVPSAALLFAMSVVMGLGIAICQTALPSATRAWTPSHIALASTVYLNGMMVGELSAAGLTRPIVLPLAGSDWQLALVLWAIPLLAVVGAVLFARPSSHDESSARRRLHQAPPFQDWAICASGNTASCSAARSSRSSWSTPTRVPCCKREVNKPRSVVCCSLTTACRWSPPYACSPHRI